MALFKVKCLWIICLIVILLICLLDDVECRRGGGGRGGGRGGSRGRTGSRSRGGSSRRGGGWGSGSSRGGSTRRSYSNVVLRGRILHGSSPYTSSTWRTAAVAGAIYGGIIYTRRFPNRRRMPPICTNKYDRINGTGRVFGHFICPRMNETSSQIYCCGPKKREYCCDLTAAKMYYGRHHSGSKGSSLSLGAIFGIVVAVGVLIVIVVICCKRGGKKGGSVIRKAPKATPAHPHPTVPPPAYDDLHSGGAGYDGGAAHGLPYQPHPSTVPGPMEMNSMEKRGLPQPQPPLGTPYPGGNVGAGGFYPPPGMPGGPMDSSPYPAPPPMAGAPYPPPSSTMDPPYPSAPPGQAVPPPYPQGYDSSGHTPYPPYPPTV